MSAVLPPSRASWRSWCRCLLRDRSRSGRQAAARTAATERRGDPRRRQIAALPVKVRPTPRAGKKEGHMRATGNPTLFPGLATPPRGAQFHVRARGRHTTASAVRVVRHPSRSAPSPPWVVLSVATCRYELQRRRPTPFRSGASKGWARSPTPSLPHYRRTPCMPIIRRRVPESGASLQSSRAG